MQLPLNKQNLEVQKEQERNIKIELFVVSVFILMYDYNDDGWYLEGHELNNFLISVE